MNQLVSILLLTSLGFRPYSLHFVYSLISSLWIFSSWAFHKDPLVGTLPILSWNLFNTVSASDKTFQYKGKCLVHYLLGNLKRLLLKTNKNHVIMLTFKYEYVRELPCRARKSRHNVWRRCFQ